ncbi:MAG: hypothetical protein PHC39_07970 [Proteiniphilum sp.]|nr:hypothetical protein [Proteiniphilum sp.]
MNDSRKTSFSHETGEYKVVLITGDVKLTSAQGVRYQSLFRNAQLALSYSQMNGSFLGMRQEYVRKKRTTRLNSILFSIMRRVVYPDPYVFRIKKYHSSILKHIRDDDSYKVILGCTPFSLLLLVPLLKRVNSSLPVIVDMSDPFSFNMGNYRRPIRTHIACSIEKTSFPHIHKIVVLNECIREQYGHIYPLWKKKFMVIEQGVDESFIKSVRSESTIERENISFTFLYAGGFYKKGRNPSELYKAFEAQKESCRLSVYGNIIKSLRPSGSDNIAYHRAIDKDMLARITAQADALILMDNDYGYQVPGKTLETLASGKPVLYIYNNEASPTLKYIREARGVVWAKNNAADIATAIKRIVNGDYDEPCFDYEPYIWEKMRSKYEILLKGTYQ